jgi:hypothetical protein
MLLTLKGLLAVWPFEKYLLRLVPALGNDNGIRTFSKLHAG